MNKQKQKTRKKTVENHIVKRSSGNEVKIKIKTNCAAVYNM